MLKGSAENVPIQLTDLDVVATELQGREFVLSEEYNRKQHIGNNRFNVLIDIHAGSFNKNNSTNNQEECEKIVGMIHDATCGNKNEQSCISSGGDCNKYRGRFLVKEFANMDSEWRELDENYCRLLIIQTLMARTVERTEDLFEPIDILGDLDSGTGASYPNSWNHNTQGYRAPRLRRSRSASNMSLDTKNALGELLNLNGLGDEDLFEPLPMTTTSDLHEVDLDVFGNLSNELNNRKKRERRRSLLRRSNSFESLFDMKKALKNHGGGFQSSKRQPSFIRNHSYSIDHVIDSSGPSPNFVSSADHFATRNFPSASHDVNALEVVVSTFQGMDIVLQGDCKTLDSNPTILGNNRLRILLDLESGRFNLLSPSEQQNTATDLLRTITEHWKGRVLKENGFSYCVLKHCDAKYAMYNLLFGRNNTSNRNSQENRVSSMPPFSGSKYNASSSSSQKPSSLLAAAPPLPAFLQHASKEILSSSRNKYSSQMSTRERQAAAINTLKERNQARLLAKQKAENKD